MTWIAATVTVGLSGKRCKWPNRLGEAQRKGSHTMTDTLVAVSPPPREPADQPSAEELDAARELVRQARAQGVALTGTGGLLKALTKTVIETALDEEMHTGVRSTYLIGAVLTALALAVLASTHITFGMTRP